MAGRRRGDRLRFRGCIAGFGTASGDRFVVGWWDDSPLGPFVDLMHQLPDGTRCLVAPSQAVAAFVSATYTFDRVTVAPCSAERTGDTVRVAAGDLVAELEIGRRSVLGWGLRLIPRAVATSPIWCALVDPIARALLPGVRTRGSAGGRRREWYGATSHRVLRLRSAALDGEDLGALAELWPAVTFGFGSAPRKPSIVELVTTVEVPQPGP